MILHFQSIEKNFIANILQEIYIQRVYDPYFLGKKDLTVLDFGANIGLFSMYAAPFSKKVYAVEPSGQIMEYLDKNIAQFDNIEAIKVAISGYDGELDLFGSDQNLTMFSAHKVGIHNQESEKVKAVTIGTFLKENNIDHVDILKLDIEGSEFETLAHESFSEAAKKIDFIIGEIHSWTGRNPNQVVQALENAGYDVTMLCNSPILFKAERTQ